MRLHAITLPLTIVIDGAERELLATARYTHAPASGDGRREPREPAHCIVEQVEVEPVERKPSVNILTWLSADQIARLEATCLDDWCQQRADDEAAAADARNDDRWLGRAGA